MKKIIYVCLLMFPLLCSAKLTCTGEQKYDWVKNQRVTFEDSEFFKYTLDHFGVLKNCIGEVTSKFDGQEFGTLTFVFTKQAKLTLETLPPETSVVKLESEGGFQNEADAIKKLKNVTEKIGLKIDWSKSPEISKTTLIETKTYWDPEPGTNGRGFLIYKDKKLVGLGYGMAL